MFWILLALSTLVFGIWLSVKFSDNLVIATVLVASLISLIGIAIDIHGPQAIKIEDTKINLEPIAIDFQFAVGVDVNLKNYYFKNSEGEILKISADNIKIDSPNANACFYKTMTRNKFGFWYLGIMKNESKILTLPDYKLIKYTVIEVEK